MREVFWSIGMFILGAVFILLCDIPPNNPNVISVTQYRIYEKSPGEYVIERLVEDNRGEIWVYESMSDDNHIPYTRTTALKDILSLQKKRIEEDLQQRMEKKLQQKTEVF